MERGRALPLSTTNLFSSHTTRSVLPFWFLREKQSSSLSALLINHPLMQLETNRFVCDLSVKAWKSHTNDIGL